jgi:hypothetical protein
MGNRSQTLYALGDSPVGLAAWILDRDIWTYWQIARLFDGEAFGFTRDDILDNITLYWLTKRALSSARLNWENNSPFVTPKGAKIPVMVSSFPEEIFRIPRKSPRRLTRGFSTTRTTRRARISPRGSRLRNLLTTCAMASARCVTDA